MPRNEEMWVFEMNSVLTSIQPKWCELIASVKKTIEVRKTRPKIETPFKCYIYCTHDNRKNALHLYVNSGYGRKEFGVTGNWRSGKDVVDVNPHLPAYRYNAYLAEGKVIGEFVCDNIIEYPYDYCDGTDIDDDSLLETQLEREDINIYAKGKTIYGWHISDIVIYDKPRELSDFATFCKGTGYATDKTCKNCRYLCFDDDPINGYTRCGANKRKTLTRPPQSWCYVEELR